MTGLRILVRLPRDRHQEGSLELVDESGAALLKCRCLGKADNLAAEQHDNKGRDPTRPYGDTPTGVYAAAAPVAIAPGHEHYAEMGPWFIPLEGVAGDALAARNGGRTGLAIHAGRGDDRLVPTHGCVRLRQADMDALAGIVGDRRVETAIDEVTP